LSFNLTRPQRISERNNATYPASRSTAENTRSKQLAFPTQNGAVEWPEVQLIKKTAYSRRKAVSADWPGN
jgi:hypothetical protein